MKRTIVSLLCCAFACVSAVAEGKPADTAKGGHSFSDAERWAGVWDREDRDEWQKPLVLLDLLGVLHGDVVADLGAGTGYLTARLSIAVGPEGKVYAVDVEPSLLDHLAARDDIVQERVVPVLAAPDDPKLPRAEVDLVVVLNTWHHIKKRKRYLEHLAEALSPEGRVAVIDYRKGELPVGPPAKHKLSRERVIEEFVGAGWRFEAESVALPYQYCLVFLPPQTVTTRDVLGR